MPPEAPRALAERSEHLIALIEDGATLAAAGRVYGIGRERVRQILEREGISSVNALPDRAERKRLRRLAVDRMLAPAVEAMWRKGMAYDEIAKALEIPIKTVRGLICERVSREERAMGLAAKLRERRTPDEWVVRGLREAHELLGAPPVGPPTTGFGARG